MFNSVGCSTGTDRCDSLHLRCQSVYKVEAAKLPLPIDAICRIEVSKIIARKRAI